MSDLFLINFYRYLLKVPKLSLHCNRRFDLEILLLNSSRIREGGGRGEGRKEKKEEERGGYVIRE